MMNDHCFKTIILTLVIGLLFAFSRSASADGNNIDKVYHPYVQNKETEIEYRVIAQEDDKDTLDSLFKHRWGFGYSPSDRLKVELYVIGEDKRGESFEVSAFELETKIQMTEQGEYWADWGLLFELEKERHDNAWALAASVLVEKEWGAWIGVANLSVEYEWGSDIKDEIESALALQGRYRLSRFLEPAVEFYSGQDTLGIGPVLLGQLRLGQIKKLRWEVGGYIGPG